MAQETQYNEDNIRSLDWKEHIRMRPGMYIGSTDRHGQTGNWSHTSVLQRSITSRRLRMTLGTVR